MKDWLSRILYILAFTAGAALLLYGHVKHHAENNILGFALIAVALFFAHWPLSWKHEK